MKFNIEV